MAPLTATEPVMADLHFTDAPFGDAEAIPVEHTCDGENVSPPLAWTGAPAGTESFVLLLVDPDAPVPRAFNHWLLFNLPPDITEVGRDLQVGAELGDEVEIAPAHGTNDFGEAAYGGPCPPGDERHTYVFRLHALDTALDLEPGADRGELADALDGHVLATAEITGTYRRG